MPSSALKSYSGSKASQISFPLGGIGSGCVGLSGYGHLIDWEIFNRPSKGSCNGNSHFAARAVSDGELLDARVLCGELPPPYTGSGKTAYGNFGFGAPQNTMSGFPNFRDCVFTGGFPFAELEFKDPSFPGKVRLSAFNPFIPLDDRDSSIPAAFFEISFENPSKRTIDYGVAFSVKNPAKAGLNKSRRADGMSFVLLEQDGVEKSSVEYGSLCIGSDAKDALTQDYWYRGKWSDAKEIFWRDFASTDSLPERSYDVPADGDHASVFANLKLKPKTKGSLRFVLSWSYPNCYAYWRNLPTGEACFRDGKLADGVESWRNYYATLFKDSPDSAKYALKNWDRLKSESRAFSESLHRSSLPQAALEAVSANLSILKSPTVLRLEDGSFYGWEGCHPEAGSCEGTCAHVWNYAYALPFLFPKLERSIRDLTWKYSMRDDGGLAFRLKLPLGSGISATRSCVDGQFGEIIKFYRDWKISGDTAWMKKLWPKVKKSLEFAWAPTNADKWDPDKSGVITGRQHHTLDVELFGANSWLTGFYLAALKAGAEMAKAVGDAKSAKEYLDIFERGRKFVDEKLFNGKWYIQEVDLSDKSLLKPTCDDADLEFYWNDERKQIKYQIGAGCEIDQVLAQWHANLCGLGDVFEKAKRRKALKAIHKHNFKRSMRGVFNPWRIFSLNDEAGVMICVWPEGVEKPLIPIPYNSETMYGFEYSAAALMIQEGLVKEGLEIVEKGRLRFDGERRNPWNEFECGSNYARSMASYSLLNAMSGFEYDMTKGMIGFSPVENGPCRFLWSLGPAWGEVEFAKGKAVLMVRGGELKLSEFRSNRLKGGARFFEKAVKIAAGKSLEIKL